MPVVYETLVDPATIEGLSSARIVDSQEWDGATWELRNHADGWVLVTGPQDPTAVVYPLHDDGDRALRRAAADAVLVASATRAQWDDRNQAGVAISADGTTWALAWIQAGEPGVSRHEDADSAHLALATQLESMAAGPVYTGSNMEDEIAQAYLRRLAAGIRADVTTAQLGDVVRKWRPHLQEHRQTAAFSRKLQVSRKFLYRVLDGGEWRRRW